jgi:O-antigen/teichoic acid export membrane protein
VRTREPLWRWPGLARSGAPALFVAIGTVNLSNFAFNLVMGRLLGVAAYGAMGALLSVVLIAGIATSGVQAAVTQSVAESAAGSEGLVKVGRSVSWGGLVGGMGMVAVLAAAPAITTFLHIDSVMPVIWLAIYLVPVVVSLVPQGVLLGQLRFRPVALANVAGAIIRLVGGVLLVGAGFGLSGAVAASALGAGLTLALLLWPFCHDLRGRSGAGLLHLRLSSTVLPVVSLGGFSMFLGVDAVLARHFLTPLVSGYYVAGLTAARIALYLPGAVVTIAFPYFASTGQGHPLAAQHQLRWALLLVGTLGCVAAVVMILVPGLVVTTLFGARYRPAASLVGILALAATALGLVNLLTYFQLSRRSRHSLTVWAGFTSAAGAIAIFHERPGVIAVVMLVITSATLAALLTITLGHKPRAVPAIPP